MKVQISPVAATEIRHHRELPAGDYRTVMFEMGLGRLRLLMDRKTKSMYLIRWTAEMPMLDEFLVHEDGTLSYDEAGRPEDGYPG